MCSAVGFCSALDRLAVPLGPVPPWSVLPVCFPPVGPRSHLGFEEDPSRSGVSPRVAVCDGPEGNEIPTSRKFANIPENFPAAVSGRLGRARAGRPKPVIEWTVCVPQFKRPRGPARRHPPPAPTARAGDGRRGGRRARGVRAHRPPRPRRARRRRACPSTRRRAATAVGGWRVAAAPTSAASPRPRRGRCSWWPGRRRRRPSVKAALRKLVRALPESFRADAEAASGAIAHRSDGLGRRRRTSGRRPSTSTRSSRPSSPASRSCSATSPATVRRPHAPSTRSGSPPRGRSGTWWRAPTPASARSGSTG